MFSRPLTFERTHIAEKSQNAQSNVKYKAPTIIFKALICTKLLLKNYVYFEVLLSKITNYCRKYKLLYL